MFRLMRYLTKRDWLFITLIIGLTVLQVFLVMTLTDYIRNVTTAITYLNYHNHPQDFFTMLEESGMTGASSLYYDGFEWSVFLSVIASNPLIPEESKAMVTSIANATTGDIWAAAGWMILVAFGMVAVQAIISVFASYVASRTATRIRNELNLKVTSFSLAEVNHFSTASLITRTTNDVQQYQFALLLILRMFFSAPITAIWAVFKIQSVSWKLMIPTIIGIFILVFVLVFMLVLVMPKFKKVQKLLDRLNGITRENLTGIRVVRAYEAQTYQEDKFVKANEELTNTQLFTGRSFAIVSPLITFIMNGISLAVYWVGAYLVNDGGTTYPEILSMMMLSTQIIMAFMMVLMMFFMIPRASVSAKRILEVLDTQNSIIDPETEKETTEVGSVEFRNVSFAYPDASDNTLEGISFSVKKGETLAFIGETGSGKSTLLNLVARLYDASQGEVLVDGVNVKEMKQKTLRSRLGFVPQKGLLFKGSVNSNIRFGNQNLTQEEIQNACQLAEADSFIQEMDGQYEAKIAQGGSNVSGGQKQRLCIARAIAKKPEILLFDDSFSALDFKTDRKVRDNLKESQKEVTKLIVAQRIGTIMDADLILVLSEGKMAGYGTHKELLENCAIYRDIALSQLSKEELGL